MKPIAVAAVAAACVAAIALGHSPTAARDQRTLPMQFELWTEAQPCAGPCRTWVAASGAIAPETPRDFDAFSRLNRIEGATIALDSDGGSVLGALDLGRAIRRLGMTTTVGKTVTSSASDRAKRRGRLVSRAQCESMCAFVLLAGVERRVPAEARVMVHQIWLGDRRDDPTAANYSAEDLVVVQRDIGRLARYTVEMGGSIDLLEIALRIPPWEPMRLLTREELRGMKIVTVGDAHELSSGSSSPTLALASGLRTPNNGRTWVMAGQVGRPAISRSHPLTVEGDEIGTFELHFTCGEAGRDVVATYVEHRGGAERGPAPKALTEVELSLAGRSVPLKVAASRQTGRPSEVHSVASGTMPLELFKAFADPGGRSLMIETTSGNLSTSIRIGNAGVSLIMPRLLASCAADSRPQKSVRNETRPGG
ncbi:MAG: hypothetical protein FJX62_19475 [Alphaproteobacteria bacterium]|nr:hypothetical protein [Alphaproteobacteria bacterium]